MFCLRKPTAVAIEKEIAAASHLSPTLPRFLSVEHGLTVRKLPIFFARDFSQSSIGLGEIAFESARAAFRRWEPFNLGWVRVANPTAMPVAGQIVAVEAYTMGLWTLNLSRIAEIVDKNNCFGFAYATTERHVEQGEERFLLEFDPASGHVNYTLEAISRPRHILARVGYPVTRSFQHRFARDSHSRMRQVVSYESA